MSRSIDKIKAIAAPLLYAVGKGLGWRDVSDRVLKLDNDFWRAWRDKYLEAETHEDKPGQMHLALKYGAVAGDSFLDDYLDYARRSKSQSIQDIIAVHLLGRKESGYFVEVGVGNGESLSNTHLMEKELGWNGLLVEPCRSFHSEISSQRKARLEQRAAYSKGGESFEFEEVADNRELSRLTQASGSDQHHRAGAIRYSVESVTMDQALADAKAPKRIDFFSLDTEGSEYEVLQGLDLNRWDVAIFVIEHNFDADKRHKIADLLTPHGYELRFGNVLMFDDWYVRPDLLPSVKAD